MGNQSTATNVSTQYCYHKIWRDRTEHMQLQTNFAGIGCRRDSCSGRRINRYWLHAARYRWRDVITQHAYRFCTGRAACGPGPARTKL